MREILPSVFHWTAHRETIGETVSSYYLAGPRIVLDPMRPPGGVEALRAHGAPERVVLTNRLHYRHAADFVEAYGCPVLAPAAGREHFGPDRPVETYAAGDDLGGGVRALEVGVLCPDEHALLVPLTEGHAALAVADGVIRRGDGPLQFVPDPLLGEDPRAVKAGLKAAYRRILAEEAFEHLLLAHGDPWLERGRAALQAFVSGG